MRAAQWMTSRYSNKAHLLGNTTACNGETRQSVCRMQWFDSEDEETKDGDKRCELCLRFIKRGAEKS